MKSGKIKGSIKSLKERLLSKKHEEPMVQERNENAGKPEVARLIEADLKRQFGEE